jgi:hypothetical protein
MTQSGLGRLAEAASTIDELSQQAQVQRALLAQKQEEADRAMTDIQVWRVLDHCGMLCRQDLSLNQAQTHGACSAEHTEEQDSMPHFASATQFCCLLSAFASQSSMEVAADRRREVELLRQQLGASEAALQGQRGKQGPTAGSGATAGQVVCGLTAFKQYLGMFVRCDAGRDSLIL